MSLYFNSTIYFLYYKKKKYQVRGRNSEKKIFIEFFHCDLN